MSYTASYRNRGVGRNCTQFGVVPGQPCWGEVQGTSRGLECHGHHGGEGYKPEPTATDIIRERQEAKRQALKAAVDEADRKHQAHLQWDARRWFRCLLDQLPAEPSEWWATLSDPVLQMVFSMIGEGVAVLDKDPSALQQVGLPAIAEVQRRGLEWPEGAYELKLAPRLTKHDISGGEDSRYYTPFSEKELAVDLTALTDEAVTLWYGCAAHVMDYSMLERGSRQVVSHLWHATEAELERRGLPLKFLGD